MWKVETCIKPTVKLHVHCRIMIIIAFEVALMEDKANTHVPQTSIPLEEDHCFKEMFDIAQYQ